MVYQVSLNKNTIWDPKPHIVLVGLFPRLIEILEVHTCKLLLFAPHQPTDTYTTYRAFSWGAGCGTDVIHRKNSHHGRSSSQHGHRLRSGIMRNALRYILIGISPTHAPTRSIFLLQLRLCFEAGVEIGTVGMRTPALGCRC